jgi:hypothetical protein
MSTPINAPDFAVVSESTPATPARSATTIEYTFGREMKSVAGDFPPTARRAPGRHPGAAASRRVRRRSPPGSRPRARRASASPGGAAAPHRDADPGKGSEFRANDHRADDQDLGVGEDAHRRDQRREHHEGEEADRELGALGGAELDLLPHDRVSRRPRRRSLGAARRVRERRLDGLEHDRAAPLEPELAELRDDDARRLARHVTAHEVAVRRRRRRTKADEVADAGRGGEQHRRALDQVRRDAQVHHRRPGHSRVAAHATRANTSGSPARRRARSRAGRPTSERSSPPSRSR